MRWSLIAICMVSSILTSLITCRAGAPGLHSASAQGRPRPKISYVIASSEMSPACRIATIAAVDAMLAAGAELELIFEEEMHASISLAPRVGEIAVHADVPADPRKLADSVIWRTNAGIPLRAEVIVGHCAPFAVAHEIAHVLEVERKVDYEQLFHASMTPSDYGMPPFGKVVAQ